GDQRHARPPREGTNRDLDHAPPQRRCELRSDLRPQPRPAGRIRPTRGAAGVGWNLPAGVAETAWEQVHRGAGNPNRGAAEKQNLGSFLTNSGKANRTSARSTGSAD